MSVLFDARVRRATAVLLAAATLALVACGSDDSDSAGQSGDTAGQPSGTSQTGQAASGPVIADAELLRQRIVGNTVAGTMDPDSDYAEYYAPDGVVRGVSYTADWAIADDQFCLDYDESPQRDCYRVRIDGDQVEWLRNDAVQGTGTIVAGNPNNF